LQKTVLSRGGLCSRYRKHIEKMMSLRDGGSGEDLKRKSGRYMRFLLIWMAGGSFVFLVAVLFFLVSARSGSRDLRVERNPFGKGEKEIPLVLSWEGDREEYLFRVSEQSLSEEDIEDLFDHLFKELPSVMKGDNPSLEQVSEDLVFPESLEGYPFSLTYETGNLALVGIDGRVAEDVGETTADEAGEQQRTVVITVTVGYEGQRQSKDYTVVVVPHKKEKKSKIEKAKAMLERKEEAGRRKEGFVLPSFWQGVEIKSAGEEPQPGSLLILFTLIAAVPVRKHFALKEAAEKKQEEARKDFPLIVHLLVLFMGAGLSFPSAVERISREYRRGNLTRRNRYAFDQVVRLEDQIRTGSSQKEAIGNFGKRFTCGSYQRLSLILIQSLSKGAKEAESMLDKEEALAFRERVEQAKKEGEKARTKLLFPMVVMLFVTMVLIMFPAMIRFYSF